MTTKDDGGPAYPVEVSVGDNGPQDKQTGNYSFLSRGVSIRDYFAAAAMAAILSIEDPDGSNVASGLKATEDVADFAYDVADAMLEARKK